MGKSPEENWYLTHLKRGDHWTRTWGWEAWSIIFSVEGRVRAEEEAAC